MRLFQAKHYHLFIALLPLLGSACSQDTQTSSPKIFGGQADHDGFRYPSLVKIMSLASGQKRFYCSAVAIGGPYVLTASHCLRDPESGQDYDRRRFVVDSVGNHSYTILGFVADSYRLREVDDHLELDGAGADIAVLKLDRDFGGTAAELATPMDFPDLPAHLRADANRTAVETAGYGYDNFTSRGKIGTLNYVEAPFQGDLSNGRELHLGRSWKSTCSGDSGGGSFLRDARNRVIGIVSRSFLMTFEPCGNDDKGHVVANLTHIENHRFIEEAKERLRHLQPDPDVEPEPQPGVFPLPGRIEGEDYRFAVDDTTPGNVGNKTDYRPAFRPSDYSVDLWNDNNGIVVGSTERGETLYYQAVAQRSGEFMVKVEASRGVDPDGGVTIRFVRNNKVEKTMVLKSTKKKGWNSYKIYDLERVNLEKGPYQIEVVFDTQANLDRLIIE